MKQSTKLLSLVLAIVMAFSCMTVIGNAALVESQVTYDSIDDAALTPEQVADIALDLVDDLLYDADIDDIDILGIEIKFGSVDEVLDSLIGLSDNWLWTIASGLIGDVGSLEFNPLRVDGNSSNGAVNRENGDLVVINSLLNFLGSNSGILSKAAYGLDGGDGISLGLISSFVSLGEVGEMLGDIPKMLREMVYDMLIFGSYNKGSKDDSYPSVEDLEAEGKGLPSEMDTFDEMVDNALLNLLINPQEYDWVGEKGSEVKDWDENAVILPSVATWVENYSREMAIDYISPRSKSLFSILDTLAPFAINDMAINALNNNLKKELMEAVEIDLNEIKESDLPDAVKTDFEVTADDGKESYVTYIAYDRMAENNGDYYYTTLKTVDVDENKDGVQDTDPETGDGLTKKERMYYKANMASGNEFASLINWDWEFVGTDGVYYIDGIIQFYPDGTPVLLEDKYSYDEATGVYTLIEKCDKTPLIYDLIKKDYDGDATASIVEGINDLLNLVYETALTDEVKADFEATVGTGYVAGANSNLMTNVNNIAKYLLANYGEQVFGSTSPYAHLDYETELKDLTTVELVAMIGPGFFEDVMPQIIIPKNADGTYAFHDGVQIYEFGALVLREFASDITPNVNYDEYIFENGDVTSADDRLFKEQGVNQWFNLILNMGLDIGYTYLYNLTNFGDTITYDASGNMTISRRSETGELPSLPAISDSGDSSVYESDRWEKMLDEAIIWGARYIGGYTSVISGFEVSTLETIDGPLNKLSYVLNKLLPLGIINGYSSTTEANGVKFDFDVDKFLNTGLKNFFTDFDLADILGLLGRNTASSYNMLDDTNVVNAVLQLANNILALVFRTTILQDVAATGSDQSLDAVVDQVSLQATIANLLNGLNSSKNDILINALPIVGKLIKGWGTEQSFDAPEIQLDETLVVGAEGHTWEASSHEETVDCNTTTVYDMNSKGFYINVVNTADGVWRRYIDPETKTEGKDKQYRVELVSVTARKFNGDISDVAVATITDSDAPYGDSAQFRIDVGTLTHPNKSDLIGGAGLKNLTGNGAIARIDVEYKVYGEDGNAYLGGQTFTERRYVKFAFASDEATYNTYGAESSEHEIGVYTPQYVPYSNAPEYVKNITVANFEHGTGGASQTDKVTPSQATVDGFKMHSFSYSTEGYKDYDSSVQLFNDYDAVFAYQGLLGSGAGSDTVHISGSVPTQEEFESLVSYEEVQTSGHTSTWNLSLQSKESGSGKFELKFYDDIYRDMLLDLVNDENATMRLKEDYITTNTTVYADRLLKSANETDDMGTPDDLTDDEEILRETDSTSYAWLAPDGTVVPESAVTVDENNPENGTYVVDGENVSVEKVTALNAQEVWNKYISALENAMMVAYQTWNSSSEYNFKKYYESIRIAVNEVEYLKGSTSTIGDAINTLADELEASEAERTDIKNYTDYQMYRLNRYNDARDDAYYYIGLKNDASNANVSEIDESFPYTGIEEDDLRNLVAGNATLNAYKGGTDNANFITALLEPLSDEEVAAKSDWLKNKKLEYAGVSDLNVEMASVYLELTGDRLLNRDDDNVYTKYLEDELASAIEMIGDFEADDEAYAEISGQYSERSWVRYEEAYFAAWDALDTATQKTVFDAKYELMCARNELVLVDEEADYSELEALMSQAEYALANSSLYENTAKELGQVLAELGIDEEIEFNGGTIDLFPGSAYYVNAQPYSVDDQDVVDQKATELKEALARLKFKGLNITDTNGNAITDIGVLVEGNEEEGIEEVTARIANIAKELDADAVKALFKVAATNAGAVDVTVSNDLHYTVDTDLEDGFAGTNSVITFYTTSNGVKIPVATVRVVVNGDINGDGAVDVLDGAYAQLVSTEKAELEGCYLLAGDLSGSDREVTGDDYGAIVNLIVA